MSKPAPSLFALIGPGLLVAATGVGAGDLATAAFAGSRLGVGVLWAVLVGAVMKFAITEGLARWQLATGESFLAGAIKRLGWAFTIPFGIYLVLWSFMVGSALISACGVAGHALFGSWMDDSVAGKRIFGAAHSLIGLGLVWLSAYKRFEQVMKVAIGLMFVTLVGNALILAPSWPAILEGLLVPRIPAVRGGVPGESGLAWTIALMGGIGGTLTVLCYGYWIRECDRTQPGDLRSCRLDLGAGYAMTALFGLAMVILASGMELDRASSSQLLLRIAAILREGSGELAAQLFLVGAWAGIFSSLLGVWQAVPYLFVDYLDRVTDRRSEAVDTRRWSYRGYLLALALVPLAGLWQNFQGVAQLYAVFGALAMPLLAAVLLFLNNRRQDVGALRNGWAVNLVLGATVLFYLWVAGRSLI